MAMINPADLKGAQLKHVDPPIEKSRVDIEEVRKTNPALAEFYEQQLATQNDGRSMAKSLHQPEGTTVNSFERKQILGGIRRFDKGDMKEVDKNIRGEMVMVSRSKAAYQIEDGEDKAEYHDSPEEIAEKVAKLAGFIRGCKYMVAFTGAGISTSCDIPDYRGPDGMWTRAAERKEGAKGVDLAHAVPSKCHNTLAELAKANVLDFVVSTNLDALHLRSGLPKGNLSELHGNGFNGRCTVCRRVYYWLPTNMGNFDEDGLPTEGEAAKRRAACDCGGSLRGTGVGFGSQLPQEEIDRAHEHSDRCDLALVLGTSMRVSPACNLPESSYKNGGNLVICNLQKTPYDKYASLVIRCRTDELMERLLEELGSDLNSVGEALLARRE